MFVEPEHFLQAVVDLGEGLALKLLENLKVDVSQLRDVIMPQIRGLPPQLAPQQDRAFGAESSFLPAIPPVNMAAPKHLSINVLPQENGRWVAQVRAHSLLNGPSFSSIGYGDSEFKAIASALDSLSRIYRDYQV